MKRILLATGGTGGHIYPAVALARALKENFQLALIGQQNGPEKQIASEENIEFFGVVAGKLDRNRPSPKALWRAGQGFAQALRIIGSYKPDLVIGFGGFASFPGVAAGVIRHIPLVLYEADARLGLVNKIFAPWATRIALASTNLSYYKAAWVGMPVREEKIDRAEAAKELGLDPNKKTVLVMPGSQGSQKLNQLLPPILLKVLKDVQVIHVTGPGRLEEVKSQAENCLWYHVFEKVHGPTAWSIADLGITRAGIGTLADAAFHGVGLIMIPLPNAAEDHQMKNARVVEAKGGGLVISQSEIEQEALLGKLGTGILSCLTPERQAALRLAAKATSPEGAAKRLADLIFKVLSIKG